ncbi:Hypothetical protein ORPV_136 [Orpheovirus IHUMI-LCC2]|uniref:Uncharacterized protein n=1 Tax=Orpheovirus IHUMI-LCC2 TaxID=2023057 RepID=A0A2I2L3F3_9VIRU|nr:Hypothetical protein ORPV_136 [Orpheovirus IHUMI-LCC2]SNW62040.1 Hypothetical protein ORPV_136 [Orpheovirus IHUMI-LCC2]
MSKTFSQALQVNEERLCKQREDIRTKNVIPYIKECLSYVEAGMFDLMDDGKTLMIRVNNKIACLSEVPSYEVFEELLKNELPNYGATYNSMSYDVNGRSKTGIKWLQVELSPSL